MECRQQNKGWVKRGDQNIHIAAFLLSFIMVIITDHKSGKYTPLNTCAVALGNIIS